jgi:polyhydroxybutyrate depolymerase
MKEDAMARAFGAVLGMVALAATASAAAPWPAGDYNRTIVSGATPRQYLLHVPTGYDAHQPLPLVFILHGFGGSAAGMVMATGMSVKADQEGFFIAYLNGTPCVPGDDPGCSPGARGWNSGLSPRLHIDVDDVGLVRDVLAQLQGAVRVDVRRVYAAGFSNGALMCHRLGAELPDVLAGVAVVEGTIGVRQPDGTFLTTPDPLGAIPVVIVHGKLDPRILYDGGQGTGQIDAKPVSDAVAFWASADRCRGGSRSWTDASGSVIMTSEAGCVANSDVVLFTVPSGVHRWPNMMETGFSATDAVWEFFSKHPRT